MSFRSVITLLILLSVHSLAQVTFTNQPKDVTVIEEGNAIFQCTAEENGRALLFAWDFAPVGEPRQTVITDSQVVGVEMVTVSGDRTQLTLSGVQREADGATVVCSALGSTNDVDSNPATITVQCPPVYSLLPNQPTTVLEGEGFTYSFGFGAFPTPTNFTWSRNGQVISSDGARIATSVSNITITTTSRSDSGVYEVVSYNEVGRGAANFTLDVLSPALIINRASQTVLPNGTEFIFNCTSEPANPPAVEYSFQKGGQEVDVGRAMVQGSVLNISSVQARDGGNYSCSANNSVGRDTVYNNLIVVGPPSAPEAITASDVGPFSATVSWQPPLKDGGAVGPLMYTVTLTNTMNGGDTTTYNATIALTMSLTNLRHSVTYQVQVVAENEAGMGPAGEGMFRTSDTIPTIGDVVVLALTLDTVRVDINISDDGGQPVQEYTVTVSGTTLMFSGSTGNVTGLTLMNGITYNVSVVARNSIGNSGMFANSFSVPFPPNITMQPVAVTPNETTTQCCAGIQVFLEDPTDTTIVFTAQVSTDGTTFTDRSVTREGDVVYVEGLQAGTTYNVTLTGRNQFGSVMKEVSATPLIGYPSDPSLPVVSVVGSSVSIQLSTRYPGTNTRGQFRFSLIFSSASTAKRQSLQPTEVQVNQTGLNTSVTTTHTLTNVGAGSYSVSVMAVNENGMSQAVSATFIIQGPDITALIIGVVVAAVILALLVILAVFIIVLVYKKHKGKEGEYKMKKPKKEPIKGDEDQEMMGPLACPYEDPVTLPRHPPPAVTYKKEEEEVDIKANPSGVLYADLDFSKQHMVKKKVEKKPEPAEAIIYSEVRRMTPEEKQQLRERDDARDGEESPSPTAIM